MRNLKRALSLALASVMVLGMMVVGTSASYADVDAADNLEAISVLQLVGVMTGDENGNFNPDKNVTRNEMAVVMCKLLDLKPGGISPFADVPDWAQPYVAACYANGITSGTSKTTYGGNDTVTTAQASLMVMKALGYFGYQGEFGDDWMVSTIKQGTKIGLYNDVNSAANSAMTRNDVAQLVLNALECTVQVVTEEGGMTVDGNGITVNVKPTYDYADAKNVSGKDYRTTGGDNVQQLCEKLYGNDLKKENSSTVTDGFKRPATKWSYGVKSVTTPDEAKVTYTAAVKGSDIYVALGRVTPTTTHVYMDGVKIDQAGNDDSDNIWKKSFAIDSGVTTKIGGNGVLTEVYYDKDAKTADIVMVNTYAAEVDDSETNDDKGYDISVVGETEKYDSAVTYEDETVVLYTKTLTGGPVSTYAALANLSTDEIKSMAVAEKVSGYVTTVKNADSFVMDGTTYKYSKQYTSALGYGKLTSTSVDFNTDAYLDAYGYVIALDDVNASTDYAVVTAKTAGSWGNEYQAKLLLPDGTEKKVDIKKASWTALLSKTAPFLVTYTKDSSDVYTLTYKSDAPLSGDVNNALKAETGKASIKVNGVVIGAANSKTEFFFYNSADDEYYAWTGIKNFPGFDNNSTNYNYTFDVEDGVVKALYVQSTVDMTDASSDVASFFFVKGDEKPIKDTDLGNYYELKAVVDGEITTVKVDVTTYGTMAGQSQIISKIKTNNDGIITSATKEAHYGSGLDPNGDAYKVYRSTVRVNRAKDDVITIGGESYAYAKDVKVFEYNNKDEKFISKSLSALNGDYDNLFVQIDDSLVVAIYYVK